MLNEEQKKELDKDIQEIVDARVQKQVEERLAKEIVKRFTPGDPTPEPQTKGFKSLGEQLTAVMAAETKHEIDPRLKAPTGLSEGVPADGGFLVQTDFATSLLEKMFESSPVVGRVFRMPLSANANAIKIPAVNDSSRADGSRHGGIIAYWAAEGGTKTPSYPSFGQVSLELKKLIGLTYATDELLQDAPALEAWISRAFSAEFDFKIADAIINGDGAAKPLGILNSPCLVTVSKEGGQAADTVMAENVIKMWASRFSPNAGNYVWLINQNIEPQLYTMTLPVGTSGMPVYMPAGGLSGAPYGSLFGRPVIPIEQAATLGDVGDIILADLSQYVLIDKGGIQSASSIHVKFVTDETAFRFVYRVDGQPLWKAKLTPYKGATSFQSPFIVLEAR